MLCVCVRARVRVRLCIPPIVTRQRLGKSPLIVARQRYRGNEYTRNNRRIVGRVVFNVAPVVSRKVGDWFLQELLVKIYFHNIRGTPSHLLRRTI
jgi:hypothetical protein